MMRLVIAAATIAVMGTVAPASAFHPFDTPTGYVLPKKFRKAQPIEQAEPAPSFSWKLKSAAKQKAKQQDDEDEKPTKKVAKKGPAQMDGGGKPGIAPVAPKTVTFPNSYGAGKIVIDTAGRKLYYVLSSSSAYQYPIAVGREGFTWTGTQSISRKVSWPDWRPPAEMLERKPELPEYMTGGIRNPLGAMALYLGNSLYRIHGTNDAKSIGTASSSGCIRMTNGHVMHLSSIAGIGTTVHVLNKLPKNIASAM